MFCLFGAALNDLLFLTISMNSRCVSSADISSKIAQYKSMLEATEKAAKLKLFASHIYEEDKIVIQRKIATLIMKSMQQCKSTTL